MTIETRELFSSGYCCQPLEVSMGRINAALRATGVNEPALILNGVPHYSAEQVDAVREHLASQNAAGAGE